MNSTMPTSGFDIYPHTPNPCRMVFRWSNGWLLPFVFASCPLGVHGASCKPTMTKFLGRCLKPLACKQTKLMLTQD